MKIDEKTKWSEVENTYDYWTNETKEYVLQRVCEMHGLTDFYEMKIGTFLNIANGNVEELNIKEDGTAFEMIFVIELKNFVQRVIEILNEFTLPQTFDEKSASKKCADLTFVESILIFVRSYFNLSSFEQAENLRICDLLIAKKDAYNNAVFQKEMIKIQTRK